MSGAEPVKDVEGATKSDTVVDQPIEQEKPEDNLLQQNYDPPDGGLKAWLTVFGSAMVGFSTFGFVNGFGVFVDYYNQEYLTNYSPTVISMIGSLQVFVLYIFAGLSGAVFDAVGPRVMIPVSGLLVVFSLFMLSLTKPQQIYQQFLTQTILFGLGATTGFFPVLALMAHWFRRRVAYALGIVTASASIGGIVFPIMLRQLIPKVGFGWTIRIVAFLVLFCYLVAILMISPRRPTRPLPPIMKLLAFEAFKDPCYTVLAIGSWVSIFALFDPFFYVGLYGATANGESALTPYYLAILCAGSIPGRVIPGLVADKFGRFNVVVGSMYVSAIFILALWYTSTAQPNLIAFSALYGFSSGPFFSVIPACVAQISPIDRVGARSGMLFAFMSTGAFAGSPVAGVFIKTRTVENFRHMILFSGCMCLFGATLLLGARLIRNRNIFARV